MGDTPEPAGPAAQVDQVDQAALVARLRSAGCVFAEEEADLLVEAAGTGARLTALADRRVAGEPLEQVLGWAAFRGLRVRVLPGVFVPRRRTEALAEVAVALARERVEERGAPVVVDLCCGSGALALAVAHEVPGAEVHAADVDAAAVACARLDLPADRVHGGDLFAALPSGLRGRVDVLVCNAPYVPTDEIDLMPTEARDHEHRVALDGGADGVAVHRRVAAGAPVWLAPGGHLLVETSRRQAPLTVAACEAAGLVCRVERDEEREATVVVARAAGSIGPTPPSSGKM